MNLQLAFLGILGLLVKTIRGDSTTGFVSWNSNYWQFFKVPVNSCVTLKYRLNSNKTLVFYKEFPISKWRNEADEKFFLTEMTFDLVDSGQQIQMKTKASDSGVYYSLLIDDESPSKEIRQDANITAVFELQNRRLVFDGRRFSIQPFYLRHDFEDYVMMKGSCLVADKFCEFAFPSDRATYLLPYPLKVNATVNQLQPTVGALIGTIVSVFGIVLVEMLVYLVFKCLRDSRLEDRKENQGFLVFEKATQNCTKREEMSKIQRLVESSCQTSAMKSQVSEAGADQARPQIVYNAATGKAYPVIPAQI